jgi:hypothetical protein
MNTDITPDERKTLAIRAFQDLIREDDVRFMLNKGERRLRVDLNDIQRRNREYYDKSAFSSLSPIAISNPLPGFSLNLSKQSQP